MYVAVLTRLYFISFPGLFSHVIKNNHIEGKRELVMRKGHSTKVLFSRLLTFYSVRFGCIVSSCPLFIVASSFIRGIVPLIDHSFSPSVKNSFNVA